ncbi:MAG: YtxH domain-containing protein [Phormidesmis sp.]
MSDNKSGGLFSGILIGTALGAVAGILATPRTGKETRRVLRKSADALPELAEDLATSVQFQADRLSANALENWEETLERLRDAIAAGQVASRQEWKRQPESEQTQDDPYPEEEYSPMPTEIATAGAASPASVSTQLLEE